MARALSVDLRQRVVDAIAQGMSRRQAAARFGVSVASAIRWAERQETMGSVAAKKQAAIASRVAWRKKRISSSGKWRRPPPSRLRTFRRS